ncbi:MAG: DMP19 family protein [Bacteroidota bacterium]
MKWILPICLILLICQNCTPKASRLDQILRLEDETEIVIQIGQALWEKADGDDQLGPLNEFEKNVLYIEMLEGQVNNGGFEQYFFNNSGAYAHETLRALQAIKAPKVAALLQQAIKAFPTTPIPKDVEKRREFMDELPQEIKDIWNNIDEAFYTYPENLTELVISYVRKNAKEFQ